MKNSDDGGDLPQSRGTFVKIGAGMMFSIILGIMPLIASATGYDSVQKQVREAFRDTPILIEIARCESDIRQFLPSGEILYGGHGESMVGLMQINAPVHRDRAELLGYNIDTLEGNIGYAKYLYERQGAVPWRSSKHCWKNRVDDDDGNPEVFLSLLEYGETSGEVQLLQKVLNTNGYRITREGAGSPGHETSYFGEKTLGAVKEFQCAKHIACLGDSGYGRIGPLSRKTLNNFLKDGEKKITKKRSVADDGVKEINPDEDEIESLVSTIEELRAEVARLENKLAQLS